MTDWDKLHVERMEHAPSGAIVMRLSGVLDSGPECYAFLDQVQAMAHARAERIVIHLENVTRLASAGVGILASCFTSVTNAGGKLCLCAIPPRAALVLGVVRFLDVVPSASTEEEAIRIVSKG